MVVSYAARFAETLPTNAMRAELKRGDTVIIEAGVGVGITVRYLLPRGFSRQLPLSPMMILAVGIELSDDVSVQCPTARAKVPP
jgi:hypothetical protein